VWSPSSRLLYVLGLVQVVNAAPSRLHWNVAPASFELNVKVALPLFDSGSGVESIVVSGTTVSTVQLKLAGVGSAFPAGSVAHTSKVWPPCAKLL
jgi:hypothetical protein